MKMDLPTAYRIAALAPPAEFASLISVCHAVILHSSRAAAHFADLCDAGGLSRSKITLATFSNAIAQSAGDGWAQIIVAASPNDAALMDAIRQHFTRIDCTLPPNAAIEGAT